MRTRTKLRYRVITAVFLAVLILPLLIILVWSFARNWPWPDLFPRSFTLRGWDYFLDPRSRSITTLLYSVILSATAAGLTLLLTFPAAKALAHYSFPFRKAIEIFLFLPVIVPTMSVAMGIHVEFLKLGLANTFIGVVLIHLIPCIPYSLRILTSVFSLIGTGMESQARVLGATRLQTLRHVVLPMMLPGMVSAFSMSFIVSFSQYFLTALIGGGSIITFPMLMFPFIQSGDRTMGSVYSFVFILTALIFLLIFEGVTRKFYSSKLKEYHYI